MTKDKPPPCRPTRKERRGGGPGATANLALELGLPAGDPTRPQLLEALARFGADENNRINPALVGLILAALDRPGTSLRHYLHHLSLLTRDARQLAKTAPVADDPAARLAVLRAILVDRYGYEGDAQSYDDPDNANLMRVIDRCRGLPVTLGLLYLHTARSLGWTVWGLAFPGHFLLRLDLGAARLIFDPFNGARRCDAPALRALLKALAGNAAELEPRFYQPVADRQVLLRLMNNLKEHQLRNQQPARALDVVERMLLLCPGSATLWREAGLLQFHQEELKDAKRSFSRFLRLSRNDREKQEIANLLQSLASTLN
tara:strand:+ start:1183 stop:2130 length:948 start_codon:yes stop_codon:yes gene_type:complete